ncbi:MAG: hypothetical protein LBF42_01575 [Puniceicoccales bacterium]|jgi:hypothetical protein|nr:hypothetical protein [Puniceicoccales bacterium]
MASDKLNWCIVRLGDDFNWWVSEVSDDIHWEVDGLGILDPNQVEYMVDLLIQLQDYGLRSDVVEKAFFKFSIEKELPKNMVRLISSDEELMSTKDKVFAMPNSIDESEGPYVDFIDHIIWARVKMLNANLDFKQPLEIEELEEVIRDEQQEKYAGGKGRHAFDEIMSILDYVPMGYSLDSDEDDQDRDDDVDLPDFDDTLDSDNGALKLVNDQDWDE